MTDFEYDCYQKKRIAHSAARRKCGSKSKKCNLPSDNMTEKQWNERCGDVMSYQIGKPMTWSEFSRLPKDLKEEYLNNLIDKYSVSARGIADMFDVSVATIFRVAKKDDLNVKFSKGRRSSDEQKEAFRKFVSGEIIAEPKLKNDETEVALVAPEDKGSKAEPHEDITVNKTRLDSFTMNFSGEINVDMIANSLKYILGSAGNAKIQIICELN